MNLLQPYLLLTIVVYKLYYRHSMKRIIIDARIIPTSTGRYVERLLHYLQKVDAENEYKVIVRRKEDWEPAGANFERVVADIPDFGFAEQIQLLKLVRSLNPDLVHFAMPQFPLLLDFTKISRIDRKSVV